MFVYIVLSRISPRLPLEGKLRRKTVMRWKSSGFMLLYNEMKICHLIRAAQSAAHLPLKGKACVAFTFNGTALFYKRR